MFIYQSEGHFVFALGVPVPKEYKVSVCDNIKGKRLIYCYLIKTNHNKFSVANYPNFSHILACNLTVQTFNSSIFEGQQILRSNTLKYVFF